MKANSKQKEKRKRQRKNMRSDRKRTAGLNPYTQSLCAELKNSGLGLQMIQI